jgi:hypothetical protein
VGEGLVGEFLEIPHAVPASKLRALLKTSLSEQ